MEAHLVGSLDAVKVYETLVYPIDAACHLLSVGHVVALPVTQLLILTRLLQIARLPNHELTHFVDEEALAARE